jgi:hypothetical protein
VIIRTFRRISEKIAKFFNRHSGFSEDSRESPAVYGIVARNGNDRFAIGQDRMFSLSQNPKTSLLKRADDAKMRETR